MNHMPIKMHIDRRSFAHYGFNSHQIFVHPIEILFLIPNIAVHLFFKGFQFVNVKFFFGFCYGFSNFGIAADIYFLGIVCATCKRRINVHKVNLNALLFEISTSGNTFATDYHITVGIFTHSFLLFHFVQRHTAF